MCVKCSENTKEKIERMLALSCIHVLLCNGSTYYDALLYPDHSSKSLCFEIVICSLTPQVPPDHSQVTPESWVLNARSSRVY